MKLIAALVAIALVTASCKPASNESAPTTEAGDTIDNTPLADSLLVTAADAPEIVAAIDRLIDDLKSSTAQRFTLELSASGYEYQTDEIWSFDSLFNLVYSYQAWASEGSEGTSRHFFRQQRLYALRNENGYDGGQEIEVYHAELGGVAFSKQPEADTTATPLEPAFFQNAERELKQQLSKIVEVLREHKAKISEGDPAILQVEIEHEDEEMPGKEVTEITVDRALLEKLLR